MRRELAPAALLLALVAPAAPALGLDVEIRPAGTLHGDGSVAAIELRITCGTDDREFTGTLSVRQGSAKGTTSVRGGCLGLGSTVLEKRVAAERTPGRPPFRAGRAEASVRLRGNDPLRSPSSASDSRSIDLR